MSHCTEILKSVTLFLKRIIGRSKSLYGNLLSLHLKGLLGIGSCNDLALCDNGTAHAKMCDLVKIGKSIPINYLKGSEIRSVA